jgi:hypothetical protein
MNFTQIDKSQLLRKLKPPKLIYYTATSYVPSLILVWNLVLTVAISFLMYRHLSMAYAPALAIAPVRYVRGETYEEESHTIEMSLIAFCLLILFCRFAYRILHRTRTPVEEIETPFTAVPKRSPYDSLMPGPDEFDEETLQEFEEELYAVIDKTRLLRHPSLLTQAKRDRYAQRLEEDPSSLPNAHGPINSAPCGTPPPKPRRKSRGTSTEKSTDL